MEGAVKTITSVNLRVRADLLPGLLSSFLPVWDGSEEAVTVRLVRSRWHIAYCDPACDPDDLLASELRLDLTRPTVRDRVIRWAGEGLRCPCDGQPAGGPCQFCKGKGTCTEVDSIEPDGSVTNPRPAVCFVCEGTKIQPSQDGCTCGGSTWARAPVDLDRFRDRPGGLDPLRSAALLWASLERMARGMGPMQLLPKWAPFERMLRRAGGIDTAVSIVHPRGWEVWVERTEFSGPEIGEEGKGKADEIALAAGVALDNGDHLLLPHPDGVCRLDLPNG